MISNESSFEKNSFIQIVHLRGFVFYERITIKLSTLEKRRKQFGLVTTVRPTTI